MTRTTASPLKVVLLAYARSFGVTEPALQRRVAARLWRAIPRNLVAARAVDWLDLQVAHWAQALLGQELRAADVRAAFLTAKLDPLFLLQPHDGTAACSELARRLARACPVPVPPVSLIDMPVQNLTPLSLPALLLGVAASPVGQTARA